MEKRGEEKCEVLKIHFKCSKRHAFLLKTYKVCPKIVTRCKNINDNLNVGDVASSVTVLSLL